LPTKQQTERQAWLKKHIDEDQTKLDAPMPDLDAAQARWAGRWHDKLSVGWTVLAPTNLKSTNDVEFKILDDLSVLVEGPNPSRTFTR